MGIKVKLGEYSGRTVYFDRNKNPNGSFAIFGGSGNGKSTAAVSIMNQIAGQGVTVIAFDTHNVLDVNQIMLELRSAFNQYVRNIDVYHDGISYPLFSPSFFSDGEAETAANMLDSLTQMLAKPCKFGVRQKGVLRDAIRMVYERDTYRINGFQAIGDALEDIGTARAFEVLERLAPLIHGNVFLQGFDFIEPGKINVFRLSKFSLDVQHILCEVLMSLLWRNAVQGAFVEHGIYLFVDECHNQDTGKNGILSQILTEGRKFNLNLCLTTQILSAQMHLAKLMMQTTVLFFKPAKNEVGMVAKYIQPDNEERWVKVLAELERGECIACGVLTLADGSIYKKPLKLTVKIETAAQNSLINT